MMVIGNCPVCGAEMRVGTDMTNADRIRAMTDEELLNWINGIPGACMDFDNESRCTLFDTCRECWLEWLKQEDGEDAWR